MIIAVGEALLSTLLSRSNTGTVHTILYYMFTLIIVLYSCETLSRL